MRAVGALQWTWLVVVAIMSFADALDIQFRSATPEDISLVRRTMVKQAMNPLSVSQTTLLVATSTTESDEKVIGFGQIRPLTQDLSELASLFVLPDFRNQGIGTALVTELLQRFDEDDNNDDDDDEANTKMVCLLTLRPTVPFYEKHGFRVVNNIPEPLQFEFKAGSLISAILGNDLVCMVRE